MNTIRRRAVFLRLYRRHTRLLTYLLTKAERNNAIVDITLRPGPVLLGQFEYTLRCQIHAALC